MSKKNKVKYERHSRPSPLLNEKHSSPSPSPSSSPSPLFNERHSRPSPLLNEHSRPSPLLNEKSMPTFDSNSEAWKPRIYVYDKTNKEDTIVQGTPSEYVLVTTQDSNLAGKAFFQNGNTRVYADNATDIKDELTRNKLRAFGIQMNKIYTEQQQEKERQERLTADSKNSKQINSVGDILVKDSLPQLGYALQMLAGGIGTAVTLGLNQDVKDFTEEAAKGWIGKYTDTIEDATNLAKDLYIDPMADGEWLTLLNNAMVNLGETMDTITGTAYIKYEAQKRVPRIPGAPEGESALNHSTMTNVEEEIGRAHV